MSAGGDSSRGGAGEQGVLASAPGKAGQGRELPSSPSTKTLGGRGREKKAARPHALHSGQLAARDWLCPARDLIGEPPSAQHALPRLWPFWLLGLFGPWTGAVGSPLSPLSGRGEAPSRQDKPAGHPRQDAHPPGREYQELPPCHQRELPLAATGSFNPPRRLVGLPQVRGFLSTRRVFFRSSSPRGSHCG